MTNGVQRELISGTKNPSEIFGIRAFNDKEKFLLFLAKARSLPNGPSLMFKIALVIPTLIVPSIVPKDSDLQEYLACISKHLTNEVDDRFQRVETVGSLVRKAG